MSQKTIKKRNESRNVGYDWKKRGQVDEKVVRVASSEMRYVSLHHHSTFSYQDGYGLPEDHVLRAAELGMTHLALTEHGNVSSHVKLEQAAKDAGIKPIFGCELYQGVPGTGNGATEKNPLNFAQGKNHLTVLAANETGYRNLLGLVSDGWKDKNFYYNMTVTNQMLEENSEGLIVLSGCTASILSTSLTGGKWIDPTDASYKRAKIVAERYREILGDRFYLEVQIFPELDDVRTINTAYERLSEETGIPLVATSDCHYYEPEQARIRQVLHSIGRAKDFTELGQEWNYEIDSSHPKSDKEILERLRGTGLSKRAAEAALNNTREVAERCELTLPKAAPLRFPSDGDHEELLTEWLRVGWKKRRMKDRPKKIQREYVERMRYELSVIQEKNFGDYFLVVSDMVKFAKARQIPVGPARGSAAASVVCWLLEITEVDPLRPDIPDLIFERFIDKTREDLPDIDLDFDDDRREEVKDYMAGRYGQDRVSNIGTFTSFKGKNSLDDVAKVYRIPQFKVDILKNLLIDRSSGDLRSSATIEDTVEMFEQAREVVKEHPQLMEATLLEGNLKTFGTHAGGLVVSTDPLNNICAVYERDGKQSISLDKWDSEYLNLLKIDVLGLSTMGMIRIALAEIGMTLEELYQIPLDDEKTLKGFQRNDLVSIFQFDGRATRSVNEAVHPDNFAEIADINALSRPGPLHSGATADYIDVKHGRKKPPSYHPIVDEITTKTHGSIIYQEQILRIVREVGNFDWTAAAYIRKIISKKLGEQEFNRQWSKFYKGCQQNDIEEETARRIWNQLITSGAYAFCATGDTKLVRDSVNGEDQTIELGFLCDRISGSKRLPPRTPHDGPCVTCGGLGTSRQKGRLFTRGECHACRSWRDAFRRRGLHVLAMDEDGMARPVMLKNVTMVGETPIIKITTEDGHSIRVSHPHRILTENGYEEAVNIREGMKVRVHDGRLPDRELSKGWVSRSVRHRVSLRDEGRCVDCGVMDDGRPHSIEFSHDFTMDILQGDLRLFNSSENIHLRCNSCHKRLDFAKGERKKKWTRGHDMTWSKVVSVENLEPEVVYDVEMDHPAHNYIGNGFVSHNNAAHCVSYGLLAWWTMWIKQHHPQAFYVAALHKYDKHKNSYGGLKRDELLRDTKKHGRDINVLPPDVRRSGYTWRSEGNDVRAGFSQVHGIGAVMGTRIVQSRDEQPDEFQEWEDLQKISGIGPKTVESIMEFAHSDDPFDLNLLSDTIFKVKQEIAEGELGPLPDPDHTSAEIPYERGEDVEVTWLGVVRHRNLKDLFELHYSRTGEELDPEEVRNPEKNEWVVMVGEDDTDLLTITVDRWRYPKFREQVWTIKPNEHLVLVRGVKKGFQARRAIYVSQMWIIDPEG